MLQRYSTIVILASLTSGFAWWSNPAADLHSTPKFEATISSKSDPQLLTKEREDLIEALQQLVLAQYRYRAHAGSFTRIVTKLDYALSAETKGRFGFIVDEAGTDDVLITGYTEIQGKTLDRISLNHRFELRANFSVSADYVLLVMEEGQKRLAELSASLAKQNRRLALNEANEDLEPEEKILSALIKRMPTQKVLRTGLRENSNALLIEAIDSSDGTR